MKLAQEYGQEFIAFLGQDGGAEFQVVWFLKARGTVGYVESFARFDPWAIADYFHRRGLVFEYLPRGFVEGLIAGLQEKAYRAR